MELFISKLLFAKRPDIGKQISILAVAASLVLFSSQSATALENTIFISLVSTEGKFPDGNYQLNNHIVKINSNIVHVDGIKIADIKGKSVIEFSTFNELIQLKIDDEIINLPIL